MSTQLSPEDDLDYARQLLEASVFGAFICAIKARKHERSLTQADLARRIGKEKTRVSKLLSGPQNWTLATISDLSEALDVRFEFALVDQTQPARLFKGDGVHITQPYAEQGRVFQEQPNPELVGGGLSINLGPLQSIGPRNSDLSEVSYNWVNNGQ